MHDWWCYLVVSAFGRVIFDPKASMHYRLHGDNAVGLSTSLWGWAWSKFCRQLAAPTMPRIKAQASAFLEIYGQALTAEQEQLIIVLQNATHIGGRLALVRERRIFRQFASDDLALRLLVLARGG